MQDRQLYAQILGTASPWNVERVELKLAEEQAVHVHLEHDANARFECPECGRERALDDHQPERRWRHLDTCQYQTILHAAQPPETDEGGGQDAEAEAGTDPELLPSPRHERPQ